MWNDARIGCFKNEADLASLSNNKLNIAKEYLERVQVRLLGASTVSVGLFKIGQEWKWIDGESYNGSFASTRVTKGRLAWSNEENDWILKTAQSVYQDVEGTSDLYFCEKMRGGGCLFCFVLFCFVLFCFVLFCFVLVWFGLVWFGLVWFGLVWFGLVWFGLVWFGLV